MQATEDAVFAPGERRWQVWRPYILALVALGIMTAIVCWHRFLFDNWLSRHDLLSFFIPWYGYLGDRLSHFDIPAWNPYLFSGSPFAADPESGWWYLPAMLAFPFFGVATAFKMYILIQLVIAGSTSYALGRVLGFGVWGAMLAATIYEFGPFLYGQTDCCTVGTQVETWIPLALLGVELAFRSKHLYSLISWWFVAGLAISQMILGWVGQGAFDSMLIVAAWVAYRAIISPVNDWKFLRRVVEAVITGGAIVVCGLAIGAAGILPKLAFNSDSTNPGGTYEGLTGAYDSPFLTLYQVTKTIFYATYAYGGSAWGGTAIILAFLAIAVCGRKYSVPFFLVVTIVIYMLAMGTQPVLFLFDLIPGFKNIHIHSPGRVTWLQMIGPSMLAGAALKGLLDKRGRYLYAPLALIPLGLVLIVAHWFSTRPLWFGWPMYISTIVVTVLAIVILCIPKDGGFTRWSLTVPWEAVARTAAAIMIALAFFFPAGLNVLNHFVEVDDNPTEQLMWNTDPVTQAAIARNISTSDPGTAAQFLQDQQATQQPFRYVGYGGNHVDGAFSLPDHRLFPGTMAILVNGRPVRLQLQQIQGYNPLQLKDFSAFMAALNGGKQNYHFQDLWQNGTQSPLLDMLNVRYIVVSKLTPSDRADVQALAQGRKIVYSDADVYVYANPDAYNRAWIVHDVRQATDTDGLAQLASGKVDGHQVAFINGKLPTVSAASGASSETSTVTSYAPEKIVISAHANSSGLLVLSEIYDKNWKATVNGKSVDVYKTNGALRGVAIPAGDSEVVMTYEPTAQRIGLFVSGGAGIVMLATFATAGWYTLRRRG
ncbi:MAG TPA: YfhO family protein [Thermomicrobiales bacterium]|nr:YfhO family protein [Thermomicrobiales bacterium]